MITDTDLQPTSKTVQKLIDVAVNPAINLAGVAIWTYTPGYAFQLTRCRSFCRILAGAVSFTVLVGGRTAVSGGVFVGAAEGGNALSATLANVRGSKTDTISIVATTNGTGQLTDGHVTLELRPFPVAGEATVGDSYR
jgi:hypothetical protein